MFIAMLWLNVVQWCPSVPTLGRRICVFEVGHSVPGMGARPGQGRRHEILIGGGGVDSYAPESIYPQNLVSPRISATLF